MGQLLTDRARVELALPAALLYRVMSSCVAQGRDTGEVTANDENCLSLLRSAAWEPLDGLRPGDCDKLRRRLNRLQQSILNPLEQRSVMFCFLAVLFWLRDELNAGTIQMLDGGNFDRATGAILPQLQQYDDLMQGMGRSAEKQARRIAASLRQQGYFCQGECE